MKMKCKVFSSKGKWGIMDVLGGLVYDADFTKKVALRIVELENSANPPDDWDATAAILEQEGFDDV